MQVKSIRTLITAGVISTGSLIATPHMPPKKAMNVVSHKFETRLFEQKDGTIVKNTTLDVLQANFLKSRADGLFADLVK